MVNTINLALLVGISSSQTIDLTHTIDESIHVWDGSCGFNADLTGDYNNGGFRGQKFTMRSCLGTHLDSPAHCVEGGADCSTLPIENFIAPAYVINVAPKAHEDYGISVNDILEFESLYGEIKQNAVVLFSTGWAKRWDNPLEFRNEKSDGIPHFPFVSEDAAKFLLARGIVGIGIDTFSPDPFYLNAPVHRLLLGAGKYIIESIANLENMPPCNAYIIAYPLKIKGGVESPIRLIGLLPK